MFIALSIALYILGAVPCVDYDFDPKKWRDWAVLALWPVLAVVAVVLTLRDLIRFGRLD